MPCVKALGSTGRLSLMRLLIALVLAAAAFVIGSVAWPYLPVGRDAGLGVLLVASILAVLAGAGFGLREARRGASAGRSAVRGIGLSAMTLALAMLPVVLFLAYCFTPLNPDAPCLT
jgi:hypothetical protein